MQKIFFVFQQKTKHVCFRSKLNLKRKTKVGTMDGILKRNLRLISHSLKDSPRKRRNLRFIGDGRRNNHGHCLTHQCRRKEHGNGALLLGDCNVMNRLVGDYSTYSTRSLRMIRMSSTLSSSDNENTNGSALGCEAEIENETENKKITTGNENIDDIENETTNALKQRENQIETTAFEKLGIRNEIAQALLKAFDIQEPSQLQKLSIPAIFDIENNEETKNVGTNIIIASETGSGKTLGFLLPIIELIKREEEETNNIQAKVARPKALIITPTRELAIQIGQIAKSLSHFAKFRVQCFTSGTPARSEKKKLQTPMDIVVTTAAKARSLRDKDKALFFGDVKYLIVDEADTILSERGGFLEDFIPLIRPMEKKGSLLHQIWVGATLLPSQNRTQAQIRKGSYGRDASATESLEFIKKYNEMRRQIIKYVKTDTLGVLPPGLKVDVASGTEVTKLPTLFSVFRGHKNSMMKQDPDRKVTRTLIFCNSISSCRAVNYRLEEEERISGVSAFCLHGEMPPKLRSKQWNAFNAPPLEILDEVEHRVLACTDIAARGLDFDRKIDHVIMFDLPDSISDFIHRIGRTARGGTALNAHGKVTLISKETNSDRRLVSILMSSVTFDPSNPNPFYQPPPGSRKRARKRKLQSRVFNRSTLPFANRIKPSPRFRKQNKHRARKNI